MSTFPKDPFEQGRELARAFQAFLEPPKWWRDYIAMEEALSAFSRKLSSQTEEVAAFFRQPDDSMAAATAKLIASGAGCTSASLELAAAEAIANSFAAAVCKPLPLPAIPDMTPRWQLPKGLRQVTPRGAKPALPPKRKIGFS
jgi:hypothetical protein